MGIAGNEGADKLAGAGALLNAIPERDWACPKEEDSKGSGKDTIGGFQARSCFFTTLQPLSPSLLQNRANGVNV